MGLSAVRPEPLPKYLNLGSGKDFRADCFNVDVNPAWQPDALIDLSTLRIDDKGLCLDTARFGRVILHRNSFQKILANDVLEHVPDLPGLMTCCLNLLAIGGIFEIQVPYDLSYGAWQDPTHIRAFNERSWLYYTDWFWYLGWSEARFTLDALNFVPSPLGTAMHQKGLPLDEVVRTPRAIDAMAVSLRKIALSDNDRATFGHFHESRKPLVQAFPAMNVAAPVVVPKPAFSNGFEFHRHRHCIWTVSPPNYVHHHAFDEVALCLQEAFIELGASLPWVRSSQDFGGRTPIIFGANLLSADDAALLPAESIIVNLEQIDEQSSWLSQTYLSLLRRYPVLDYSARNLTSLARFGVAHARLLGIGFSPGLKRIEHSQIRDIDVLFYGSLNERRAKILSELRARGLNVVHLFGAYGPERDATIARAKLVLNMHFYDAKIFEIVRVFYLLANEVCIVSEGDPVDPDIQSFVNGLTLCPYKKLVETCLELVNDGERRKTQARRGFELIAARRQSDLLRELIQR
jgi:hypothetical protein